MARIGILTLYAAGHVGPSLTLARALESHGHETVFFNLPDTEAAVAASGIRFVSYGAAEYPLGSLKETMQKTAELSGQAAFAHYLERMAMFFRAGFRELPELLKRESLDLLVVDQVHYAGGTLAEHAGIPFVTLANALLTNREDVIPPPVMLWPYDDSAAGIERNHKGWAGIDHVFTQLLQLVNVQRVTWGLPAYANLLEDSCSRLLQIAQQPAFFDFPRRQAPATLQLVGPLKDDRPAKDVTFDWEWLDGRPVIYASCGTLQNRLRHVFEAMIEACAGLDAQTVIALGRDALDPASFHDVPANVKLTTFAPQRELLRRAALCITHAGLNTTLDCLEMGVPMVAIPIASEQPGVAMRIAHLGAGKVVALTDLNSATLGAAVGEVFAEPRYRAAAQAAAKEMVALHSAEDAVRLIEAVRDKGK